MAQSGAPSPTSTSTQNQQSAPQQPGALPTSPLQEPAKVDNSKDSNTQTQSKFDITGAVNTNQDQEIGEIRLMTRNTSIGGDPTRSFRVSGENQLGEFNYFFDHSSGLFGNRRIQMLSMYRGTNDQSIDPEHNSLQKAYFRVYGPKDEYIIGDTLVNFSRLTFNQNVKGMYANWKLSEGWRFAAFGGIFIDRYGSLYLDIPGKPYLSTVSGARLEHRVLKDSLFGINFATSDDHVGSLPTQPLGTTPLPASNRVVSVDTRIQLKRLRLDGEVAESVTDFDERGQNQCASPCDTRQPQPGLGYQFGWGARLEASYRFRKLNLRGSFVRYQPNFASMNARQVADLQDWLVRGSYDLSRYMTVDGTVRRSNNDLGGQLPFQTTLMGPEGHVTFHDLPWYRRGIFELGYRQRDVNATDHSIDRGVRMPYAEFSMPYHTSFLTIGVERRQTTDNVDPTQTSNVDHPYVSLRGIYDFGGWHINPIVRFELERQHSGVFPGIGAPGSSTQYLLASEYASNRLAMFRFLVETPKWFIIEASFRDASATLATVNTTTGNSFLPGGYARPNYEALVTYKIRNDENKTLSFSYLRDNNYYFLTPNFDERVVGVTFSYKFGHRATSR